MGSPGSANGRRGEYVRIPEDVEVAAKGEADAATAVKAAAAAECPTVLRWRAIRWWAKVAVLGIFLAGAGAAAVVFLGPLVIKKRWLERWPKKAAFVRLAGEGDWHHQFKAVALLRISPFPYIVFNYASVATNVKYCPYIAGSMAGTIHETFLAIYSGKLLQSLAVATSKGSFLSVDQIIYNGIGFTIAAASTAAITINAKKALQKLQAEDEVF
ncbi:unnamed protein product [Urochloa humidicola]